MRKASYLDKIAFVAAIFAAAISYQLLKKHVAGASGSSWFDQGCTITALGNANCTEALESPYAYLPPKHEGRRPGLVPIPAAFYGLVYFAVVAVWYLGIGRPSYERRRLHWIPLFGISLGLLGSIYFVLIMLSRLNQWCPWCALTHVLNFMIALCTIFLRPRKPVSNATELPSAPPSGQVAMSAPTAAIATPSPAVRQIVLTVATIVLTAYACYLMFGMIRVNQLRAELREYKTEVDRIRNDARGLLTSWQMATKQEFSLTDDTTIRVRSTEGKSLDVVVFSDFECPACAQLARYLEDRVNPLFAGRLRMIFKHFPLHADCNELLPKNVRAHPRACEAARLAEAARIVGGNDAFSRTHDFLFANQQTLKKGQLQETFANTVGLDSLKLQGAFDSQEPQRRIDNDLKLAKSWSVQGTPTIFVDGRMVPRLAKTVDGFWDELANHYWNKIAQQPRPESARLKRESVTQDSQDLPTAP